MTRAECRRRPGRKSGVALDGKLGSMSKLLVTSAAEQDFTEALCWYTERSLQAAEGFEAELVRCLESIKAEPGRFPRCDPLHRYYLMRRYPYQIIYRERQDCLIVIAVAHAKRRPGYWANR
jgi:plasmid stabilization system protein ParE